MWVHILHVEIAISLYKKMKKKQFKILCENKNMKLHKILNLMVKN